MFALTPTLNSNFFLQKIKNGIVCIWFTKWNNVILFYVKWCHLINLLSMTLYPMNWYHSIYIEIIEYILKWNGVVLLKVALWLFPLIEIWAWAPQLGNSKMKFHSLSHAHLFLYPSKPFCIASVVPLFQAQPHHNQSLPVRFLLFVFSLVVHWVVILI